MFFLNSNNYYIYMLIGAYYDLLKTKTKYPIYCAITADLDAKTKSIFYPDLSKFNQPLVKLGAFSDDFCQEVYESAVLFIRAMSNSRYQMVALYLDNVRSYTLTLDNGTLLILGRGQQKALTRLKRFLEAFGHSGLNIDDVEYVDLRYDVGFAVGKKSQS